MKRLLIVVVILAFAAGSITAQKRNIARGAESGEFYISDVWYGIYAWGPGYYETLRKGVFRLTENGKKLTIQYDANYFEESLDTMYPFYILADATPGVVYMGVHYSKNSYPHTALWVSFDYGKNWTFREENIGDIYYYPANFEGLIYKAQNMGFEKKFFKSKDYGNTWDILHEQGHISHSEAYFKECEFFGISGSYPTDPWSLYYTSNCYNTFILIPIDEEFVFGNVSGRFPDVYRGGRPGEVYIDSWFPDRTYKVSFSADTGRSFRHVYVSDVLPPDDFSYIRFMSDREPGVFYIIRRNIVENFDPWGDHSVICIDYYRDYGETLVDTYCHDLTKDYVTDIGEMEMKDDVVVYPNPTKGTVFVGMPFMASLQNVEIFDLMGRRRESTKENSPPLLEGWQAEPDGVVINISNFPTGMYFVRIQTDKGIINKKIIKY